MQEQQPSPEQITAQFQELQRDLREDEQVPGELCSGCFRLHCDCQCPSWARGEKQ